MGGGIDKVYQLGGHLGKGAFATVRSAMNISTGETVAVKVIVKSRFFENKNSLSMFARERTIIQSLEHPAIVSYKGFFEDPSSICEPLCYMIQQVAY